MDHMVAVSALWSMMNLMNYSAEASVFWKCYCENDKQWPLINENNHFQGSHCNIISASELPGNRTDAAVTWPRNTVMRLRTNLSTGFFFFKLISLIKVFHAIAVYVIITKIEQVVLQVIMCVCFSFLVDFLGCNFFFFSWCACNQFCCHPSWRMMAFCCIMTQLESIELAAVL